MIRQWSFFFQFFYVLGTIPIKASICVLVRIKRSLPWAKHATHGFSCLVGHIDSEQLGLCRHAIFLAVARADDEGRQGFSSPRSSTRRTVSQPAPLGLSKHSADGFKPEQVPRQ
ncbi:hypothetical protein IWX50DRAFT_638718 [Phyllosticta citricarpa]